MFVGSIVLVISLVAASFCSSVSGLLATQGVLYAIGGMSVYFPTILYIGEWFVARRGMAYGVMVSILLLLVSTGPVTDGFP